MSDDQISVKRKPYAKVVRSRLRLWHIQVLSQNGEILLSSETYYSYSNARRAGRRLANVFNIALKED